MIELVSDWPLAITIVLVAFAVVFLAITTKPNHRDISFYVAEGVMSCIAIVILAMALMSPVHTDEYAICDIDYSDGILFVDGCNDSVAYNTQDTSIIKAAFTAKPGDLVMLKIRDRPFGLQSELMSMEVATR